MPARKLYDHVALKQEYVQGTMTMTDLARTRGVRSVSTLSRRAKREGWDRLRTEFQRQVDNKSLEKVADRRAEKIADIHMDSLAVIHAGILKLAEDMTAREPVMDGERVLRDRGEIVYRPAVRYTPRDLATLIDKFLVLTGQPNDVREERHLGIQIDAEADRGTLEGLLGRLRPRAALARGGGEPEESDPSRTRPN